MTTLTKADRQAVLTSVLAKSFKGRFEKLKNKGTELVLEKIKAEHTKFYELWNDVAAREYLRASHYIYLRHSDGYYAMEPVYGTIIGTRKRGVNYIDMLISDYVVPATYSKNLNKPGDQWEKAYTKLWNDYNSAYDLLSGTLEAYKTVEKLEQDFPEYAKLVPKRTVVSGLPMVIPQDVRDKLKDVGVPEPDEVVDNV
jgi:hypothetical protein